MTRRTDSLSLGEKGALCAIALLLGIITLALLAPEANGGELRSSDGVQYERIAFNMVRHGAYDSSRQLTARNNRTPYFRREPGYPLFLASVFALSPEFGALAQSCISDGDCEAAAPVRTRVQWLASFLAAVIVASTFLAAHAWTRSWLLSIAAGLFYLVLLPTDISSILAALLLFVHAVLAAEAWKKPRLVTGAVSGIALGLLVLTKAVFQYWLLGVTLAWATGLWYERSRRRSLLPAGLALLVFAGGLTLPWMTRNAVQAGHFGISGRNGEIFAIRAEYGRMTWSEVRGAFAFYLPSENVTLRAALQRWLEPEAFGYARFERSNPSGFYSRAKTGTGEVAARADQLEPAWRRRENDQAAHDAVLGRAATELIREDWRKHAVLTLAFLARGTFFDTRDYDVGASDGYHRVLWMPVTLVQSLAGQLRYLFLPALGLMLVIAWRRRSFDQGFILLPILYVIGIHAVATHFIPRYAYPVVPLLVLVFSIAVHEVWLCAEGKRH